MYGKNHSHSNFSPFIITQKRDEHKGFDNNSVQLFWQNDGIPVQKSKYSNVQKVAWNKSPCHLKALFYSSHSILSFSPETISLR